MIEKSREMRTQKIGKSRKPLEIAESAATMPMSHRIFPFEQDGDTLFVQPTGDALQFEEHDLRNDIDAIHQVVDNTDVLNIIVDVERTAYLSSVAIGAVMVLCSKIQNRGGRAVLCNVSDGLHDVLDIMKIDSVLTLVDTREDAVEFLKRPDSAADV